LTMRRGVSTIYNVGIRVFDIRHETLHLLSADAADIHKTHSQYQNQLQTPCPYISSNRVLGRAFILVTSRCALANSKKHGSTPDFQEPTPTPPPPLNLRSLTVKASPTPPRFHERHLCQLRLNRGKHRLRNINPVPDRILKQVLHSIF